MTSQKPHILIPLRWWLGIQHKNLGRHKCYVHNNNHVVLLLKENLRQIELSKCRIECTSSALSSSEKSGVWSKEKLNSTQDFPTKNDTFSNIILAPLDLIYQIRESDHIKRGAFLSKILNVILSYTAYFSSFTFETKFIMCYPYLTRSSISFL